MLDFGRPQWDATVAVNLDAAFEMSYEAAQRMVPQRSGKIINICSLFSFLGGPVVARVRGDQARPGRSDEGLLRRARAARHPGQRRSRPGTTRRTSPTATRSNPETNQRVLDHIPAGRWGDPFDLMGAVVFLASRASDYVNGHVLVVDGGYLVR